MLVDTSVARNFAIAGWADALCALSGGMVRVAQGVLGTDAQEPGELDRAREFFERQTRVHPAGSPEFTNALVAQLGLEQLIARRSSDLVVLLPTPEELALAGKLADPDPAHRRWRQRLGMRARRLDSGEAISIAVAVRRKQPFGCDDEDARVAYRALGGTACPTTLDLVRRAVGRGLLPEREAREGYERLRTQYRFFGPPWP